MVRALQLADPRLIGPYRLVGQLGSGGMGRVFLGMSVGGRPVAVKKSALNWPLILSFGAGSAERSPLRGG